MFGSKNHPTDTNREEKLKSKIEDLEGQIKEMRHGRVERKNDLLYILRTYKWA